VCCCGGCDVTFCSAKRVSA